MTSGKSNLGLGVQAIGRPLAWSVNGLSSNPSTNKRGGEKSNAGEKYYKNYALWSNTREETEKC